ncbi:hypothetical protein HNP86_001962 [Methanococcus maripaludis]|uniref:Uncharacterized protein n=1 Tax=Methanococcus maripaludis TaxID=39152 RepID=A0A7J9NXQ4_METMI|nr:hypothetical protein [Methanococcus maripaludis]MBA2851803.1 hypothetical protein [Methanococcus maripaludis]
MFNIVFRKKVSYVLMILAIWCICMYLHHVNLINGEYYTTLLNGYIIVMAMTMTYNAYEYAVVVDVNSNLSKRKRD